MVGQPTYVINDKSSCIDLLFTANSKLYPDVGVTQTVYDKCHHNITYESLNLSIPLFPPYIGQFEITKTQIPYVHRLQFHY